MTLSSSTLDHDGWSEAVETYIDNGWTDGLPVIPPTPDAVSGMLAAGGLSGTDVLGTIPTRSISVSAEKVAINAVMAGCKPEYFGVVVAAVKAILQPIGNAHSTTAT
ncbi:MAG TPA: UGSC family (seleno)protein, partial [Ilumatobacteraceae bacterium]|nr:UGSC family (seleno)protein [Ilumatobacteraceae bacterium]